MKAAGVVVLSLALSAWQMGEARAQGQAPQAPNLLTLAEGAVIVAASANAQQAPSLADGSARSHWMNVGKRDPLPYSFVFELRAPTVIEQVAILGAGKRPGGVQGASARGIVVEASAESADKGFRRIAAFDAAEDGETKAAVADGAPVRWLRVTISSNHGSPVWTYVSEVIARGNQTPPDNPPVFTGIYQTGPKGLIELKQDGSTLVGCYIEQGGFGVGTLSGHADRGVARLTWTSDIGITGPALLVKDSRGRLNGVRFRDKSRTLWIGSRAPAGAKTQCSQEKPPANPIADALNKDGKALLYGILFDFDKATLRPESRAALEALLDALKRDGKLALALAGHTDSDGSDDYNLALSRQRAEAVVAWLVERGIARERLTAVGKGESEPVASNDTAEGRALNRRVEAIRS